jgi:hypothetical protein
LKVFPTAPIGPYPLKSRQPADFAQGTPTLWCGHSRTLLVADHKLILPAELKVCATCTYWDGTRSVDDGVRLVVVCESCQGECLVRQASMPALRAVGEDRHCLWDGVSTDDSVPPEDREKPRG